MWEMRQLLCPRLRVKRQTPISGSVFARLGHTAGMADSPLPVLLQCSDSSHWTACSTAGYSSKPQRSL